MNYRHSMMLRELEYLCSPGAERMSEYNRVNAFVKESGAVIDRVRSLFDAIAHGDEIHRAWLDEAILNHFAGKPVPKPRDAKTPVPDAKPKPIGPWNPTNTNNW